MSILLDALKKSETQRQLGETPTIHTQVDGGGQAVRPDPNWIPPLMIAISALVIGWLGWQQYRVSDQDIAAAVVETEAVAEAATQGAAQDVTARNSADSPGAARTDSAPSRTPVERFANKSGAFVSDEPQRRRSEEDVAAKRSRLNRPLKDFKSDPAPETVESSSDEVLEEADQIPFDESGYDEAEVGEFIVRDDSAELRPQKSTASRSRMEPHEGEPINYWQVPQALRDGMPELKIMVLVYAEEAEDRFLLINGQRLVENEELEEGLLLEEIRREGAVFTYRNYRFMVKG
jgi:general secretion pathway protein B